MSFDLTTMALAAVLLALALNFLAPGSVPMDFAADALSNLDAPILLAVAAAILVLLFVHSAGFSFASLSMGYQDLPLAILSIIFIIAAIKSFAFGLGAFDAVWSILTLPVVIFVLIIVFYKMEYLWQLIPGTSLFFILCAIVTLTKLSGLW